MYQINMRCTLTSDLHNSIWGVAAAYWIDFGFTRLTSQISWRFPIGFQAFFAIVSGLGMLCLPDTPRWYVQYIDMTERQALEEKCSNFVLAFYSAIIGQFAN